MLTCAPCPVFCSLGYFKQRTIAGEVGSSTMPHKVRVARLLSAAQRLSDGPESSRTLGHLSVAQTCIPLRTALPTA